MTEQLAGIVGREVFIVICWLRGSVTIAGVSDTAEHAETLRLKFIEDAPDKEWEKASGERRNNTWAQSHFIDGVL